MSSKENVDVNKNVERKRPKTLSKNGKIYYKISPEINRAGQIKYYKDNKNKIAPNAILSRLEKTGNIPQIKSLEKYPNIITEETIMKSYKKFKEHNEDPEKFIHTKNKLIVLLKKINDLGK